jgi:uncharacterized paraquat-inducible protein A
MKCQACEQPCSGGNNYCPRCGSAALNPPRNRLGEILWIAAVLALIVMLTRLK